MSIDRWKAERPRLEAAVAGLRKVYEETGLSHERLAHAIGVGYPTVARILSRGLANPNPSTVRLLMGFIRDYELAKKRGDVQGFLEDKGIQI